VQSQTGIAPQELAGGESPRAVTQGRHLGRPPRHGPLHVASAGSTVSYGAQAINVGRGEPEPRASDVGASIRSDLLRRDAINRRLLALADVSAILCAAVFTAVVVGAHVVAGLIPLSLLVIPPAKLAGLYDRDDLVIRKTTLTELPKLLELIAAITCAAFLFRRNLFPGAHSREVLVLCFSVSGAMLIAALRGLARLTATRVSPPERCLIIGDQVDTRGLARAIAAHASVKMIGTISIEDVVESPASVGGLVDQLQAHRLVIEQTACVSPEQMLELVHHAKVTGAKVSLQPTLMAAVGGAVVFDELGGQTLLGIPRFGLPRSSQTLKRAFDLLVSTTMLLLLAPVLVVIAVLIRLDSPGPALFRQVRVGRDGQLFSMFKFRSMVANADAMKDGLRPLNEAGSGMFKITNDPRLTRTGRLIRRLRLDELPQLFNVVRGEMSLVGPRPLVVEEDERVAGFNRHRLHLTPGMTGRWQVLGTNETTLDEMSKLDVLYIANWSMWQDIRILIQTAGLILARKGV